MIDTHSIPVDTIIPPSQRVSPERKPDAYPPLVSRSTLDVKDLQQTLDGSQAAVRNWMRDILGSEALTPRAFDSTEDERETVLRWCQVLADKGVGAKLFPKEYGGDQDLAGFFASFEMLAYHNLSLTIKFGVQYGLFGGSVLNLGTAKHHERILSDCNTLKLPGCFAMTELGHGSNVRQIETTATYCHESQTFDIHSPSWSSGKIYIGNSARDGEMASVFAQLHINGEDKGVHAFLVPIRDPQKNLLPGIHIDDNGRKIGLNGVDNGLIWFDHVTVPKGALLDRFAKVDDQGQWSSEIEGDSKRFFTMLGTLVGGRMSIAGTAVKAAQKGLTIATKYAHRRRQFGAEGAPETLIIDYPTHQRRLGAGLASTIALSFAIQDLTSLHHLNEGQTTRTVETRAAALKAYATWESMDILQDCREACGGEGYLWKNQIGELKADLDVFTTFEGDNTVLMQLVAKGLFANLRERFKSGELTPSKVVITSLRGHLRKVSLQGIRPNWHDLNMIGDLLLAKENGMTLDLAQVMRKKRKQGFTTNDLMIEHQLDLIALGKAYAERLAFQSITNKYLSLVEGHENTKIIKTLALSFGIERILRAPSWFYNAHYLNAENYKNATSVLHHTYDQIAEVSLDIVNAFGIPTSNLTAPIAQD